MLERIPTGLAPSLPRPLATPRSPTTPSANSLQFQRRRLSPQPSRGNLSSVRETPVYLHRPSWQCTQRRGDDQPTPPKITRGHTIIGSSFKNGKE